MIVHCLHDKLVPISKLKLHPKNRNKHPPEQVERLAKILKYQGWRYPVKVSKRSGFVTAGHGRIEAAKAAGWKQVPVNFQDYESDEQEYADLQADNAIALWAELDLSGINGDLGDLGPDFDLDLLGIKNFTLDPEQVEAQCDEDEVPEEPVDPKTRLGDIYQLGRHRLMCGDSSAMTNVERLLDGAKIHMVHTDPPYGMKLNTDYSQMPRGGRSYSPVIGDDKDFDPNPIFAVPADRYCIWGADWFYSRMPEGFSPIVWDKQPHHIVAGPQNHFELCWVKPSEKRRIVRKLWTGFTAKEKGEDRVHPTQKPVEVCVDIMERGGQNVLDLYGGSGSTLIACEKTDRTCFMMELDPSYCDAIVARWEKYTGKKAELLTEPSPHVFPDGSTQHLNA
jgi:DNA modification methylase